MDSGKEGGCASGAGGDVLEELLELLAEPLAPAVHEGTRAADEGAYHRWVLVHLEGHSEAGELAGKLAEGSLEEGELVFGKFVAVAPQPFS